MPRKLQFVWPKDGPKGRNDHGGFFGRMGDVLTNRGPDIFIQRKKSKTPIAPEEWGNWDSYHMRSAQYLENSQPHKSRGRQRYDPETRKYVEWHIADDFYRRGVDGLGPGSYPRFTMDEWSKMARRLNRGRPINPRSMGSDWNHDGPNRFQQKHDWFWQNAHQTAENIRQGLHPHLGVNQNLQMHQQWPQDLNDWMDEAEL
ncbi:hypothetical protein GLAREA_09432 [Glarea lozoyensis ATCC 20868]|uniref:Uncharacterized protein n=1 Tax=Glarea lozoyensis (strain ATCC 20868 / MF5171) TaxID=1116229 RepID=S3CPD6_GLAL2|nr:uncharacterized protein GLAREA_09432 [Glarea lozoyensis ATCC 20868]EPE28312.1 hypothetical protein GLAREA_09432 [Glarea lozoyensis ATCC 20868]